MRPFNLEEAKAGKPIMTRAGVPVKFLCHEPELDTFEVVFMYNNTLQAAMKDGIFGSNTDNMDLVMAPEKKEYWVNSFKSISGVVYTTSNVYGSRVDAMNDAADQIKRYKETYLSTVKIYEETV